MNQPEENARRVLRAVAGAEAPGEHEAWLTQLPEYVEDELAGEDLAQRYPELQAHLDQCESCSQVYAEMVDLALAEAAGQLPEVANLPPLELPPPARLSDFVRRVAGATLDALSRKQSELDGALRRFFEALPGATAPLEPAATAQAFGLGQPDTPALALVIASYYAFTAVAGEVGPVQPGRAADEHALRRRLDAAARAEAHRVGLTAGEVGPFAATFVKLALDALRQPPPPAPPPRSD